MVNQPTPVEVANKLLHRELLPQRLNPLHTVVWVPEDSYFPINALEGSLCNPVPQLLVSLVALDRGTSQGFDQFTSRLEEGHQALLTLLACLRSICCDMDRKGQS